MIHIIYIISNIYIIHFNSSLFVFYDNFFFHFLIIVYIISYISSNFLIFQFSSISICISFSLLDMKNENTLYVLSRLKILSHESLTSYFLKITLASMYSWNGLWIICPKNVDSIFKIFLILDIFIKISSIIFIHYK